MNIVSTMVGMTIMAGATVPVMNMSIAPAEAAARARNFGIAETAAVVFAATYESTSDTPIDTDNCDVTQLAGTAYSVTCTHGTGKYAQSVTRAFRLDLSDDDSLACDNDGNNGHGNSGGYDCSNPGNSNKNKNKNK